MSNPFSTANSLDPEAGFTQTPSVAQAANDLRVAAGEKALELVHTAEEKAAALKDRAKESAQQFRELALLLAHRREQKDDKKKPSALAQFGPILEKLKLKR